jgi:hypothetical protein
MLREIYGCNKSASVLSHKKSHLHWIVAKSKQVTFFVYLLSILNYLNTLKHPILFFIGDANH